MTPDLSQAEEDKEEVWNKRAAPATKRKRQKGVKKWYVRQAIEPWSSFEAFSPFGATTLPTEVDGSCGVMMAYGSMEAFAKAYPGERPLICEKTEKAQMLP